MMATWSKSSNPQINSHKTMGLAKVPLNVPSNFLKKHSKETRLPKKQPFHYDDLGKRKPPIPIYPMKDDEFEDFVTNKDYVLDNALAAVKSVPQMPITPFIVDTRTGEGQLLTRAGICSEYINKKNYGQVPYYIKKRVKEVEETRKMYNKYLTSRTQHSQSMQQIQEEERMQLLMGLRENWQDLNRQYLSMSLVVDSFKKKIRKEILEQQMTILEKDIQTLQNDIVLISG